MSIEDSRQRFNRYAQRYVVSPAHAQGADLERLLALARPQPHWQALDVATGGGHTALRLAPHVAHVVASDLAANMLAAARTLIQSRGAGNITFALADAQDLPFDDETFDLVTCRIAPHHFEDCARFVRECARVLRHAGCVVIQDHALPPQRAAARYTETFEKLRDPSHNRAFTELEWKAMLEQAGLGVTDSEIMVKRHEFLDWARRQDCTPQVLERLSSLLRDAPAAAAAWLQPLDVDTPQATFANHHVLVAARKDSRLAE